MVLRGRGGVLGATAAVVFVTGLATSTITQSAVSYSTRLVANPESRASVLIRTAYGKPGTVEEARTNTGALQEAGDSFVSEADSGNIELPNGIENVAFQVLYQPIDQPWPMTEPSCSSGDCRWQQFDSLALCYDMQNVTDKLKVTSGDESAAVTTEQHATLTLPIQGDFYLADVWSIVGGLQLYSILNFTSPWPNLGNSARFMEPELNSFPNFRESIAHASDSDILRATASQWFAIYAVNAGGDSEGHHYRAVELLWHFCVNTYNVSVEGGKPKMDVVATNTEVRDGQGHGFEIPLNGDVESRNFTLVSESGANRFSVFNTFDYQRLDLNLRKGFEGGYSTLWGSDVAFNEFSRGLSQKMFAGIDTDSGLDDADERVWDNLEELASAVADASTDFMRKKGTTQDGQVLTPETFVRVRWAWISFIAAQVGLSVLLLICIAYHTARLGIDVVKSSNMSALFVLRYDTGYLQLPAETTGLRPSIEPSMTARLEESDGTWELKVSRRPVSPMKDSATSMRR